MVYICKRPLTVSVYISKKNMSKDIDNNGATGIDPVVSGRASARRFEDIFAEFDFGGFVLVPDAKPPTSEYCILGTMGPELRKLFALYQTAQIHHARLVAQKNEAFVDHYTAVHKDLSHHNMSTCGEFIVPHAVLCASVKEARQMADALGKIFLAHAQYDFPSLGDLESVLVFEYYLIATKTKLTAGEAFLRLPHRVQKVIREVWDRQRAS